MLKVYVHLLGTCISILKASSLGWLPSSRTFMKEVTRPFICSKHNLNFSRFSDLPPRLKQGPEHPNVKRTIYQAMWGILFQQHLRKPLLSNPYQKTFLHKLSQDLGLANDVSSP